MTDLAAEDESLRPASQRLRGRGDAKRARLRVGALAPAVRGRRSRSIQAIDQDEKSQESKGKNDWPHFLPVGSYYQVVQR